MTDSDADKKAAAPELADRGERTTLMEPLRLSGESRHSPGLGDLTVGLAAASAGLRRSLPPGVVKALADLVRETNCYYSNLIEGHDTHPADIERALKGYYSSDPEKRNLQREAKAHVAVQEWIDEGGLRGRATAVEAIRECHQLFGDLLPEELLRVKDLDTGEETVAIPGELRRRAVKVGRHVPVSPGAVPGSLQRFETIYGGLGKSETILAAAAAHHRLLWIHPFLDCNGRVARLMSHAMLFEMLDTGAVWSIARGLARNESRYKEHLTNCDLPWRNDLDGRGPLSEEALADFTRFFLETCLNQVRFMEQLVEPNRLRDRVLLWVEEEVRAGALPAKAGTILEAVLFRGELPRAEVSQLLGASDRQARRITAALLDRGVLVAESTRAPLFPAIPAAIAPRWMPGLFPPQAEG